MWHAGIKNHVGMRDVRRFDDAVAGAEGTRDYRRTDHTLTISDDDDTTRLRILAEQHTFKAGDDATIRVHWREEPTLALVTYQGARVLGYQLVTLSEGENEIPIDMAADLAPNFDLHIAVMTDPRDAKGPDGNPAHRYHDATTPLTVQREMNVQIVITGDEATHTPGDDVEVEITTTDPQGRPLSAEVSLAMIEQALLDRFGDQTGEIDDVFRGQRRESALRSGSSVTFSYNPETRNIDRELLAEQERLEIEAEEKKVVEELALVRSLALAEDYAKASAPGRGSRGAALQNQLRPIEICAAS